MIVFKDIIFFNIDIEINQNLIKIILVFSKNFVFWGEGYVQLKYRVDGLDFLLLYIQFVNYVNFNEFVFNYCFREC